MKRIIILPLAIFLMGSCGDSAKEKELEAKINEFEKREQEREAQENKYKISRLEGYWQNSNRLKNEIVYIQESDDNVLAIKDKLGGELLFEYSRSDDDDKLFVLEQSRGDRRLVRKMEVISDSKLFMLDEEFSGEEVVKKESANFHKISVDEAEKSISTKNLIKSGNYEYRAGDSHANLEITKISESKCKFRLTVGTASACTGEISGNIDVNEAGKASYSTRGCEELAFTFGEEGIRITESNCEHHGARCSFEGFYQ